MTDYALEVTDAEIARYRLMAELARTEEAEAWRAAGIVPGARVADVGCGPAAVAVAVAAVVGAGGSVVGVEPDPSARAAARRLVAEAGAANVEVREGSGTDTGIPPGSVDVALLRHVLAHNGGREQAIVDHLASLVRPGGAVYLVDVDGTAMRVLDADPGLADINERYAELHRRRGNDLRIGLRLGRLLAAAGLEVERHAGRYLIGEMPPGIRPPAWAARDALRAQGLASEDDLRRWEAAFERMDAAPVRPITFAPFFVGIGRRR
ncbi:methyltransferase domain-containing protein [Trujillonella endophytica]|uniref:Methyltransferase domain-containing protein n=1 Tax=Trujillonella endophytica TaxID=673521 RepID=A0A1H8VAD2_9ACTN|nr:methyltransferase domain-containing protein [Trujillella endophytica]SEP11768.1 Methyltransferase domain-containing protein [Trujillella endophytica]